MGTSPGGWGHDPSTGLGRRAADSGTPTPLPPFSSSSSSAHCPSGGAWRLQWEQKTTIQGRWEQEEAGKGKEGGSRGWMEDGGWELKEGEETN